MRQISLNCCSALCLLDRQYHHKFHYAIVGHSGSSADLDLVSFAKPPVTDAEKYAVVEKIYGTS